MKPFQNQFAMGSIEFGQSRTPILVAETACAHEGDAEEACRLVDAAANAGADMVQLQVFRASEQVPPSHKIFDLLLKLELSDEEWAQVFAHAANQGKEVMAFVYDLPSLEVAKRGGVVALKLNSSDLLNRPLLIACAESGLPLFLGTGASTMEEISKSLSCLAEHGAEKVILMHGVQDFPTALADSRMDRIQLLRQTFGLPVGYGDHTDASDPISRHIDLVALGLGVDALEKHITLNRSDKKTDYQAALNPDEWEAFANLVREAATSLSDRAPVDLTEADHRYRKFQKKYAVAARAIEVGTLLVPEDVKYLRLEETGEISAVDFAEMGPVRVNRNLAPFETLLRGDLEVAD